MSQDIAQKLQAILAEMDTEQGATMQQVTDAFRRDCLPRYAHNQGQFNRYNNLCDLLDDEYCDRPIAEFGPKRLAELRRQFVKEGNCRKYVNAKVQCIRNIVRHAVAEELAAPGVLASLNALEPLKSGQAKDNPPREAVELVDIKATMPNLSPQLQAMVRIQLATGCRPSELFRLCPSLVDRSGDDWVIRPEKHKTAHHGRKRAIPVVGLAREALEPYLLRGADELCFQTVHGNPWNRSSYRQAIQKAAVKAGVPKWSPYQMRHATAQVVRDALGPVATQALLGHARLSTTEVYSGPTETLAIEAAKAAPQIA